MSLKTDNFKLYKYEDNDIGDLRFINDSMDIIDKGINPFYVATQSSTNVYKVTTGLNKTSLANGYSIKVAIPSNSTGSVSIIVDSVTVPVKKPNGGAVTNFKQNGVYSLTYYNSVFILASGGVDDVNFTSDKLLTGYSANDSNGNAVAGTMPNKGAVTQSLSANGSLTLPKGYYDSIKITQNIPNRGEYQMAGGIGSGDDYIALNKIPYGYYPQSSNGWAPEIRAKKTDVAKTFGITADKIVEGNNILGIVGTVTIESLGGARKFIQRITVNEVKGQPDKHAINVGFKPRFVLCWVVSPTVGHSQVLHIYSTDINGLKSGGWIQGHGSSSSGYWPKCKITGLHDNGFYYGDGTNTISKDATFQMDVIAIG